VTASEVLAAATPSRPFAVKDSFARLDLDPSGFQLLAGASWIARASAPGRAADNGLSWDRVTSPGELSAWETAWSGGSSDDVPLFRPELLSDPRCAILACRQQGSIIAGAIAYAADGVAGISNAFIAGPAADRLWVSILPAVAALRPNLPVVGYEDGTRLETARQAGFHVLGALRIWARPPLAPEPDARL
jgi:hypothetical protein